MASVRRLSAIMFTDMVGSTAAAQTDESRALKLRDEQADLVRPLFASHKGREIKSMGDGFLAEFDSALHAVQCAIDIQQHLHERNSQSGTTPIRLRIGIHLGDVEQRASDIFGDAVNIASRIEPAAEPGGICVSGAVHEQVRNKTPERFEKLPPMAFKGLQEPIDVFRIVLPWDRREPPAGNSGPTGIAILPFTNISPDPNDEYFADGLTEELITVLSQLRDLRVISRTSVMLYKATPKSASQIGTELGVASILEGSVRKAGSRIRVTAQLIEAASDRHLWAKTYDRSLDDIFAVQSELAQQVAEALQIELRPYETARLGGRPKVRPESYLAYLKGRSLMRAALSASSGSAGAAMEQFELAISLDSRNAAAYSGLADAHRYVVYASDGESRALSDRAGRQCAARALELDPSLAEAHASLALIIWDDYEYATAEKEYQLALSLNPSYSFAHCYYGILLEDEGRADDALHEFQLAEAADPLWPENLIHLTRLLGWLGRFEEAWAKVQKIGELVPNSETHLIALAWYYSSTRSDSKSLVEVAARMDALSPKRRVLMFRRAWLHAILGEKDRASAFLREAEALPEVIPDMSVLAWTHAELGDLDGCFRWMNEAYEKHALMLQPFRLDPRLENVRSDPRFRKLLEKMHLA